MFATLVTERPGILARIADNPNLPTPPAVALRVLEKASEPNCTLADLEDVITLDPALCCQLLRTVNSALYGLPRAVTSVRLALSLLGTTAVRSLVLSLSLPALQKGQSDSEATRSFWRTSLAGAVIAREMAIRLGWEGPEDYLIAGLLRDLGTLVLPQVFPEITDSMHELYGDEPGEHSCELEEEMYGVNHAEVGAHLLNRWRLPADITEPIRFHHNPEHAPGSVADRAWLLHFASKAALLQVSSPYPILWDQVASLAANHFGLNETQLLQFLEPLDSKMAEFAVLVRVDPGPWQHYPTVLAAAAELGRLMVAAGQEQLRLREQRDHAEQEAGYWRRTARRFHKEAIRDPLTGCYNRGFFEAALARTFRQARRSSMQMGLLFVDLNKFKKLNDEHGHAFGDHVLKSVAGRLMSCARTGDVVARYGGDEFCVIASEITGSGLASMARRLRQSVSSLALRSDAGLVETGAAVGAALCLPCRGKHSTDELLAAADAAMYEAKHDSSGDIHVTELLEEEDRQLLVCVESQLFSTFLIGRGLVTARDIVESPRSSKPSSASLAVLARQIDWLPRTQLAAILREQRQNGWPFVEAIITRGDLTPVRLAGLLALQRQNPEALAAQLVQRDLLTEEKSKTEVQEYYAALRST